VAEGERALEIDEVADRGQQGVEAGFVQAPPDQRLNGLAWCRRCHASSVGL